MAILLTGGAGYIGSHTALELVEKNYSVIIIDDFSNSSPEVIRRISKFTEKTVIFYEGSLLDELLLQKVFSENDIDTVIHFAGFKSVGESIANPLKYYQNNITSTLNLLQVMSKFDVKQLVFSSSATVYGLDNPSPVTEEMSTSAINPYGYTKLMIEQILSDLSQSDENWSITCLRYFNPVGAHESGLFGESPNGTPNNLVPFVTQVAVGKLKELSIYGDDYETIDGTGVRDYIHVVDLAQGHIAALAFTQNNKGFEVFNLGTGKGNSVLELVHAFEKENKKQIPYKIKDRRAGDVAVSYADTTKALQVLGWSASKSLEDMMRDSWNWQRSNPDGYAK